MKILTSCKVKTSIKEHLSAKFPEVTFQFCEDINEAVPYLLEAEVLITYGEDLTDTHIQNASNLKWIMVISAGLDQMPFSAINEKGILVTNARGIHKIPMAEYAIAMILQVSRQTKQLIENEALHKWDRTVRMNEITGKTMMVVGAGAIGQEVARLAKAFQMTTIGVSRSGKQLEYFDEVIKGEDVLGVIGEADFVISVLPKTEHTKDFFTFKHFEQMKNTAIFLNMGRGEVVKEDDLIEALHKNEIGHAVLDVFTEEPLPDDHLLWHMENVTITPHLSGISRHYQARAFEIFEYNLQQYMNNGSDFLNVIDPKRGY